MIICLHFRFFFIRRKRNVPQKLIEKFVYMCVIDFFFGSFVFKLSYCGRMIDLIKMYIDFRIDAGSKQPWAGKAIAISTKLTYRIQERNNFDYCNLSKFSIVCSFSLMFDLILIFKNNHLSIKKQKHIRFHKKLCI